VQIPCTQGGNQKSLLCKGRIKKNTGGKTKPAHITKDINLFTLKLLRNSIDLNFFIIVLVLKNKSKIISFVYVAPS
jgi:hypothetical protein